VYKLRTVTDRGESYFEKFLYMSSPHCPQHGQKISHLEGKVGIPTRSVIDKNESVLLKVHFQIPLEGQKKLDNCFF